MKIIVTGAAGFIGSHLVDTLVEQKHTVFGIDDLSTGFKRNINSRSHFIHLDLRHKQKTSSTISKIKPQIIYHLAADATEGRSQFTPLMATERNYTNYLNVLIAAINSKVKRIVLTSSMSVYGNQTPPFTEDLPTKPVDIYGIAKAAMEQSTQVLSNVFDFEYVILRPHNVYGPRQNIADPYRNVVGIFINRMLQHKPFYIYGNGNQRRSFSYIEDVIPCIARAGFLSVCRNEIINIGPRTAYSIMLLSQKIIKCFTDIDPQFKNKIAPQYLPKRPQEVDEAVCSDIKARKLLNFNADTSLDRGIRQMIKWAMELGPQKFTYLPKLEIENKKVPQTWSKRLL